MAVADEAAAFAQIGTSGVSAGVGYEHIVVPDVGVRTRDELGEVDCVAAINWEGRDSVGSVVSHRLDDEEPDGGSGRSESDGRIAA